MRPEQQQTENQSDRSAANGRDGISHFSLGEINRSVKGNVIASPFMLAGWH
jgi:hypothetical protein